MTRGDQRDRDRAKNLLKQQQKLKSQGKVRPIQLPTCIMFLSTGTFIAVMLI